MVLSSCASQPARLATIALIIQANQQTAPSWVEPSILRSVKFTRCPNKKMLVEFFLPELG